MAQRVELHAALWAAEKSVGALPVVTDCEYVNTGARPFEAPSGAVAVALLHGRDGDLHRAIGA